MIGKAFVSIFKFYDIKTKTMQFKKRPVLIIGQSDESDYVVLPISRVTNRRHIDSCYDVVLYPLQVPLMNLTQTSYVRTHKQTVLNIKELMQEILNFQKEYSDLYVEILTKVQLFQNSLMENAFPIH